MVWSFPRLLFLSHTVGGSDVEPLQPRQCGLCEVPCLASIKEDQLHNCLVEVHREEEEEEEESSSILTSLPRRGCKCLATLLKGELPVHDCRDFCCYSGVVFGDLFCLYRVFKYYSNVEYPPHRPHAKFFFCVRSVMFLQPTTRNFLTAHKN